MEKENIPAYRVAQVEDKIILAKFDKNDLVYKSFFDGIKLDESRNWLYLKNSSENSNLEPKLGVFLFSDNMDDCYQPEDVEEVVLLGNMALIKRKGVGYVFLNAMLADKELHTAAADSFAILQKDGKPSGKFSSKDVSFFVEAWANSGHEFTLGEKIDSPEEDVYAFWNGEEFSLLLGNGRVYFFARKKCKSFRAEEKGFILELENGTKDFFPYYQVPLEFKK